MKAMLELRPNLSKLHCSSCVDVMQWIVRTKMAGLFPDEVGVAVAEYDACLTQTFVNMKREGVSMKSYWALFKDISVLAMPMAETQRLMDAKLHWMDVATELDLVTTSTTIGRTMFGFAHELVVAERMGVVMEKFSRTLVESEHLSSVQIANRTKVAHDELNAIQGIDVVPKKRVVIIMYRGVSVEVQIFSLSEELTLRAVAVANESPSSGIE
jgi:hypothetical protein